MTGATNYSDLIVPCFIGILSMVLVYLHSLDMKERYGKVLECTLKEGGPWLVALL